MQAVVGSSCKMGAELHLPESFPLSSFSFFSALPSLKHTHTLSSLTHTHPSKAAVRAHSTAKSQLLLHCCCSTLSSNNAWLTLPPLGCRERCARSKPIKTPSSCSSSSSARDSLLSHLLRDDATARRHDRRRGELSASERRATRRGNAIMVNGEKERQSDGGLIDFAPT